jgi:5-dehydro-2-deoxygluconokinase
VDPVHEKRLFWAAAVTGPSEQPSRSAHHAAREARGRRGHAVLVLDFGPMFWSSWQEADGTQC